MNKIKRVFEMSSSTTQQKKSTAAADLGEEITTFHKELLKKIRNKQKKVDTISGLEQKVKNKEINANTEQLEKIASKPTLEAEIKEIREQVDMYIQGQNETRAAENKAKKQHAKEIAAVKRQTITNVANMLSMHCMLECGQTIPEDIDEGVKHFSECINKLLCRGQGAIHWR